MFFMFRTNGVYWKMLQADAGEIECTSLVEPKYELE